MEVTVHLDGDPAIREEGFLKSQGEGLLSQIRSSWNLITPSW